MARVFISYKRSVTPDHDLAGRLNATLEAHGHQCFLDREDLRVGMAWAETIDREIKAADFFIVLLSERSAPSEMVRGEVEIARREAAKGGRPVILPVRLAFPGTLPYPLNSYLDHIQYALWKDESETGHLEKQILDAVAGKDLPHAGRPEPDRTYQGPVYAQPLPVPGGTLDVEDPWYVERASDKKAIEAIRQTGKTISIKGPRQIGKSSLLVRIVAEAIGREKRAALVDLQLFGADALGSAECFFRYFAAAIADQLELAGQLDGNWDSQVTPAQNCTRFVERHILKRIPQPLVLAVDEADSLTNATFRNDFFGMIRSWHNSRANPLKKDWKRLDLVMATSTEPFLLIDRGDQSPFNVGEVLLLENFTEANVSELNRRHGGPLVDGDVFRLWEYLGGHPYLTRRALYCLSAQGEGMTLARFFEKADDDDGPLSDHLRNHLLRIYNNRELSDALLSIISGKGCRDEKVAYRLQAAGLVARTESGVVPRCRLYADYFRKRLENRG
jgi:hypothetical protein